jgi:catechol 2,3-dioxygenase
MTLGSPLKRLHLCSPQPQVLADFYVRTYGMVSTSLGEGWLCTAPGREVAVSRGPANQLRHAQFEFTSAAAWSAFTQRQLPAGEADLSDQGPLPTGALGWRDPDGNLMVMLPPQVAAQAAASAAPAPAMLQHFALRSQNLPAMVAFYEQLGFTVSDRVKDGEGQLKACFLRTDVLHHNLALFGAPINCFDHQSFETTDWNAIKLWADHMGGLRETIVWGVGRHGPGNDLIFHGPRP